MDAQSFCYWLQGFVELCPNQHPTISQWNAVKDHLQLVFNKVTPQYTPDFHVTPNFPLSTQLRDAIVKKTAPYPVAPSNPAFPGLSTMTC